MTGLAHPVRPDPGSPTTRNGLFWSGWVLVLVASVGFSLVALEQLMFEIWLRADAGLLEDITYTIGNLLYDLTPFRPIESVLFIVGIGLMTGWALSHDGIERIAPTLIFVPLGLLAAWGFVVHTALELATAFDTEDLPEWLFLGMSAGSFGWVYVAGAGAVALFGVFLLLGMWRSSLPHQALDGPPGPPPAVTTPPFAMQRKEEPMYEDSSAEGKRCPACAETVKQAALICRFCGYDFRVGNIGPLVGGPFGAAPPRTGTNGFAIASLVLSLVWIYWIGSILAVVFGHIAVGQINRTQGTQGGKGMAVAGLVIGYVAIGFAVLAIVIFIADPGYY
jgi:hypothetical protein